MGADWAAGDEPLVTGWEHELPGDDTLVRAYTDAFAEMVEAFALAAGGRVRRDEAAAAGDAGSPSGYLNGAILLAPLTIDAAPEVIGRLRSFFAASTGGPWLLFSATPTPDLRPLGLQPVGHPPLMFRPASGAHRPPPTDLEVVEIDDRHTLATFERTLIDAYPFPELADARSGSCIPPEVLDNAEFRFFLGLVAGEPVGTSMAHLGRSMSHVEYVTSTQAVRGRGYGEAMTWPATQAAPDQPSMLIASDAGRPTYERMGYLPLTRATLWLGAREAS